MRRPLCVVCLFFVLLILFVTEIFPYEYAFFEIASNESVSVEGRVTQKEMKNKDGQTTFYICLKPILTKSVSETDNFQNNSNLQKIYTAKGILCQMSSDSEVPEIGSRVILQGNISAFKTRDNPGEFDTPLYYQIKGVDLRMYEAVMISGSERSAKLLETLFQVKVKLCNLIDNCFDAPYNGIAKAVFLSMSTDMDEETKEMYQRNGMLHILCVSGLHVSILGMGSYKLLKKLRLPDGINAAFCMIFMVLYGLMIGMGISVLRAVFMFLMRMTAGLLKRTYDLLTAACTVIFLILLQQPLYIYHSGFLLSFMSVVALGTFRRLFPDKICSVGFLNKRAEGFFSSLTVWLLTLPIFARCYYEVSISGLFLNVLILPFVGTVLIMVILVCLLGTVYLPLGIFLARLCQFLLLGFEGVFGISDSLGHTTLITGYVPLYKCMIYYMGISLLLVLKKKWKKRYLYTGLGLLCFFLLFRMPKDLTITCLSVGQGDCAVVEYKNLVCVIDAGSQNKESIGKYTILPYLKYRGIKEVDYLFLTHSDSDHINGAKALLEQSDTGVSVKRLGVTDKNMQEEYGELFLLAESKGIEICEIKKGNYFTYKGLQLECLAPSETLLAEKEEGNETSMVLLLKKDNFSMLFMGDSQGEGEQEVMSLLENRKMGQVTVLKVAHHGSKNSTPKEFLSLTTPALGIISCGKNNHYGHPHTETLERLDEAGVRVVTTKDKGAVTVVVNRKIEVYSFKIGQG